MANYQVWSGHKASVCTEFLALTQVLQRYLLIQLQYHFALEDPREALHKESRSMQYNGILQFHYLYRPWKESTSRKVDAKEFNVALIDMCVWRVLWKFSGNLWNHTQRTQDQECEQGETSHGNAWDKRFPWSHTGFPSSILPLLHLTNLSPQHPEFLLLWHPFLGSFITSHQW